MFPPGSTATCGNASPSSSVAALIAALSGSTLVRSRSLRPSSVAHATNEAASTSTFGEVRRAFRTPLGKLIVLVPSAA